MAATHRPVLALASIGLRYGRSCKLLCKIGEPQQKVQPPFWKERSHTSSGAGPGSGAAFSSVAGAAGPPEPSSPADVQGPGSTAASSMSSSSSSGSSSSRFSSPGPPPGEDRDSWNKAWNPRTEGRAASIFDRARAAHSSQYSAFPLDEGEVHVPKMHDKVPQQGLRPKLRGGTETDPQENEFPGKGHRRAWNDAKKEREQHMKGVDTTRLPLSKKEYSIQRFLDRAPDNLTNMHAREDAEDAFGSNKKPKVSRRRKSRPGAVTIPMGR